MCVFSLGSTHSSTSDTSSDHEDMPTESLSQLTSSLKAAQARVSSLSTNVSRLGRLVLDDDLERLDQEIAQVREETYAPLKRKYTEALEEYERKKRISKARL